MITAVIPARGNSKGIPKKNIQKIGEHSLIGWTIESLKKSKCFEKIVVTSDSEEILDVAKDHGAETFRRQDPEFSNDVVMPDMPVIEYLESLARSDLPEYTFLVQCTSPFVSAESYNAACQMLLGTNDVTVFAAKEAHAHLWRKNLDSDNWAPVNHPFHERIGRQYRIYREVDECGAFYGLPTKSYIKERHRFFKTALPFVLSGIQAIDIDTYEDLEYARYLYLKNAGSTE